MTSRPDSPACWLRLLVAVVAGGLLLAAAATWWAWRRLPITGMPAMPHVVDPRSVQADQRPAVDQAHWQVNLWKPLRDAPVVDNAAPPPPLRATLFSILQQGGQPIAAVDFADEGLVYLQQGQQHNRCTVQAIEAEAVVLIDAEGRTHRLELGR